MSDHSSSPPPSPPPPSASSTSMPPHDRPTTPSEPDRSGVETEHSQWGIDIWYPNWTARREAAREVVRAHGELQVLTASLRPSTSQVERFIEENEEASWQTELRRLTASVVRSKAHAGSANSRLPERYRLRLGFEEDIDVMEQLADEDSPRSVSDTAYEHLWAVAPLINTIDGVNGNNGVGRVNDVRSNTSSQGESGSSEGKEDHQS